MKARLSLRLIRCLQRRGLRMGASGNADAAAAAAPAGLPQQPEHAKKASIEDVFEHRWRKAYEVRALERESRQGKGSQGSSRRGSFDLDKPPAADAPAQHPRQQQQNSSAAGAGAAAAAALSKLSISSGPADGGGASGTAAANGTTANANGAAGNGVPSAGQNGRQHRRREQEIDDDDEEEEGAAEAAVNPAAGSGAGAGASTSAAAAPRKAGELKEGLQEGASSDEEDAAADCRLVWDSSSKQPGQATQPVAAPPSHSPAAALKEQGNALLKEGKLEAAVRSYTAAMAACQVRAMLGEAAARQAEASAVGCQGLQGAAGSQAAKYGGQQAGGQANGAAEGKAGGDGGSPSPSVEQQLLATLHSNRAHALNKLKRHQEAAADAAQAHRLHPTWTKPLYRLAQARMGLSQWAAAVAAAKQGEALASKSSEGHSEFTPLLDRIAVHAARAGSLAGFDGQQLEVRDAGDDAWLGRPAPYVPELDGPEDEDLVGTATTLALPDAPGAGSAPASIGTAGALAAAGGGPAAAAAAALTGGAKGDALAGWDYRTTKAVQRRRRTSFRSVKEAVEAARDGDRILLRRGTHNGMGECVTVSKRLLIEGEGELGETVIDQRANVPTFRITRGGVVLRSLDLDQTGFREALLVDGASSVHPLVANCRVKCSGDDAVNVGGAAAPTFLRCVISAKKAGLVAAASSAPRLEQCVLEKCGEQGLRAMEQSAPLLHNCTVAECEEEAVVGMDSSRLTLHTCSLHQCKGPGVDLSGSAQADVVACRVERCVGGVWAWEGAAARLRSSGVAGGPSHALLADGEARLEVRDSTIQGTVHATDAAWQGILHPSNSLADPDQPTDFPPEDGPFRFVPNPYSRKQ